MDSGFNLNSSYYQSENVDLVEQADVNYRHNGLDMFAMFRYDKMNFVNAPMYIRL